jgi:hypothetical protein
MKNFIYIRALRHVDHSVFSVSGDQKQKKSNQQKHYRDPIFGQLVPYASGQQVKRSMLEILTGNLNTPFAAITFNWEIDSKDASQGEAWSLCDPSYPDQLFGGYMMAKKDTFTIKRRSPLSISAMRPIHPLLGNLEEPGEAMSFDRGAYADQNKVNVFKVENDQRIQLTEEEIAQWLKDKERTLPPKKWIEPQKRANGLFVYDVAIDLRTLFCVSTNQYEPEVSPEIIEKLKVEGWTETENVFGKCLVCPETKRAEMIQALADAVLSWRVTTNQARTFSPMETLAVAISDDANQITYAIRAELDDEVDFPKAKPVLDPTANAKLFLTPAVSAYIKGEKGNATALDAAAAEIASRLTAFPYENQLAK